MATRAAKKPAKGVVRGTQKHTGWSVAAMLVEGCFGLVNTNKIFPLFGLLFVLLAGLIVWKLPGDELAVVIKLCFETFATSWTAMLVLLIATNVGWFTLLCKQRVVYMNEIDRLSDVKKELLHSDNPVKTDHVSSESAITETYILPGTSKSAGNK